MNDDYYEVSPTVAMSIIEQNIEKLNEDIENVHLDLSEKNRTIDMLLGDLEEKTGSVNEVLDKLEYEQTEKHMIKEHIHDLESARAEFEEQLSQYASRFNGMY